MRRARWKRKNVRRVGPHICGPPAAGGGRLALPRGSQGRKRAALGVIQARGSSGYLPLRFPLPLTLPRRTSQRQRKEEQRPCVDRPGEVNTHSRGARPGKMSGPARAGRRPEVLPASTRETPVRAEGHCTGARQKSGLFFWTVHGPFSFPQDGKENGGWNGPAIIIAESPGRQVAAPTPLRRSAPGGSRFGRSRLPLPLVGLPPRRERRVFRGEGGGDMSANPGCVVPFFAEWDVDGPFRCCSQI